jgi:hypothetical protein
MSKVEYVTALHLCNLPQLIKIGGLPLNLGMLVEFLEPFNFHSHPHPTDHAIAHLALRHLRLRITIALNWKGIPLLPWRATG